MEFTSYTTVKGTTFFKLPSNNDSRSMKIQENPVWKFIRWIALNAV